MEKKSCIRCKKEKTIDEFDEGRKSCNKCLEHRRAYYKNVTTKDYIYCMVCDKRRDPMLWDDHFERQEHKEGLIKQLENDYKRLVEEAPTSEFKQKYYQEGQDKIWEIKKTMFWHNPELRRQSLIKRGLIPPDATDEK